MQHAIKYDGTNPSYFRQMTRIGPQFGATEAEAAKFATPREAHEVMSKFPTVAYILCEVVEVGGEAES